MNVFTGVIDEDPLDNKQKINWFSSEQNLGVPSPPCRETMSYLIGITYHMQCGISNAKLLYFNLYMG